MKRRIIMILSVVGCLAFGHAQNISETNRTEFDAFLDGITSDFDNFRSSIMVDFAEFVKNPWKEFQSLNPIERPKEKRVPPEVIDKDTLPLSIPSPVIIDKVVKPVEVTPQPQPVEEIKPVAVTDPDIKELMFFGTSVRVRYDASAMPAMTTLNEDAVANALKKMSTLANDNLVADCMAIRKKMNLCDWGYLLFVNTLCHDILTDNNDANLLEAYILMRSGYKVRMGISGNNLFTLYGTRHMIYEKLFYQIGGDYYYSLDNIPARMRICEAVYPGEQSLSLLVSPQKLAYSPSLARTVKSRKYPQMEVEFSVNKNLVDFYNTYPSSSVDDNFMTRWAIYANTPLDENLKKSLYPQLLKFLEGKNTVESANMLLDFVQTGLRYDFDDEVWGGDRIFFAEESLYYPGCDCEDRAILYTRLVRDLLGLDCLLVYYPGHVASAINFGDIDVAGDWLELNGKRYVIADPTILGMGAPVGYTMKNMDNSKATVILLE